MSDDIKDRIKFSERNTARCPFVELDMRARAKMSANSQLTYGEAVKAARYEDPDLTRLWLDSPMPRTKR